MNQFFTFKGQQLIVRVGLVAMCTLLLPLSLEGEGARAQPKLLLNNGIINCLSLRHASFICMFSKKSSETPLLDAIRNSPTNYITWVMKKYLKNLRSSSHQQAQEPIAPEALQTSISQKNSDGDTALMRFMKGKDPVPLVFTKEEQQYIMKSYDGRSFAVSKKRAARNNALNSLLNKGENPNTPDSEGNTPLMIAVESQDETLVQTLLAHGAEKSINAINNNGACALTKISFLHGGGFPILIKLLNEGAKLTEGLSKKEEYFFANVASYHEQAGISQEEMVNLLLPDQESVTFCGETLLIKAAQEGNASMVSALIKKNINVNCIHQDEHGNKITPVKASLLANDPETAQLLLKHGATLDTADAQFFWMILEKDGNTKSFEVLLKNGFNPNNPKFVTKDGDSPLLWMIKYHDDYSKIRLLLYSGADYTFQGKDGKTFNDYHRNGTYYLAIESAKIKQKNASLPVENSGSPLCQQTQESLVSSEALQTSINQKDSDGDTALMRLLNGKDKAPPPTLTEEEQQRILKSYDRSSLISKDRLAINEAARALLCKGADPNISDSKGNTPLMIAIQRKNRELITILLQHGAKTSINAKNNEEMDVLTRAVMAFCYHGHGGNGFPVLIELFSNGATFEALAPSKKEHFFRYIALYDRSQKRSTENDELQKILGFVLPDKKSIDLYGGKLLIEAAKERNYEMVEALINKGTNINYVGKDVQNKDITSVQAALLANDTKIARLLIKHGATLDVNDANFFWAILGQVGNTDSLEVLLENGFDPNNPCFIKEGDSPLLCIVKCHKYKSHDNTLLLLRYGADDMFKGLDGKTFHEHNDNRTYTNIIAQLKRNKNSQSSVRV